MENKLQAGEFGHSLSKGWFIINEDGATVYCSKDKVEYDRIYDEYHGNIKILKYTRADLRKSYENLLIVYIKLSHFKGSLCRPSKALSVVFEDDGQTKVFFNRFGNPTKVLTSEEYKKWEIGFNEHYDMYVNSNSSFPS